MKYKPPVRDLNKLVAANAPDRIMHIMAELESLGRDFNDAGEQTLMMSVAAHGIALADLHREVAAKLNT